MNWFPCKSIFHFLIKTKQIDFYPKNLFISGQPTAWKIKLHRAREISNYFKNSKFSFIQSRWRFSNIYSLLSNLFFFIIISVLIILKRWEQAMQKIERLRKPRRKDSQFKYCASDLNLYSFQFHINYIFLSCTHTTIE